MFIEKKPFEKKKKNLCNFISAKYFPIVISQQRIHFDDWAMEAWKP